MAANSFGTLFKLTTFGESHGAAIGGILEGCPARLHLDIEKIQLELDRRKPGQSGITTQRKESDTVRFLSGIFEGKTLGTPIGFVIENEDQRSVDYDHLKEVYRPGHADEVWEKKFGIRDYRGGGRSSARETAARVVGGAIAKQFIEQAGLKLQAYVSSVKDIELKSDHASLDLSGIDKNIVRCPDQEVAQQMIALIEKVKAEGDSVGGVITCVCSGIPFGIGEPVFDKLNAVLAHAMLSINATKGFVIDDGFDVTKRFGSENNTIPSGISGGIANGNDIVFKVAFKPVSTISKAQKTHNTRGEEVIMEATGRHDPCVLPRAVPIVEAMAALVFADMLLLQKTSVI
jgi:chorismate synthase